jgi:hypothetical protein
MSRSLNLNRVCDPTSSTSYLRAKTKDRNAIAQYAWRTSKQTNMKHSSFASTVFTLNALNDGS